MKKTTLFCAGLVGLALTAGAALSQTNDAASSGPAVNGSPAWFLADMSGMIQTRAKPKPDGGMAGCEGDIAKFCSHTSGSTLRYCLLQNAAKLSGQCKESASSAEATSLKRTLGTPYCYRSPVCDPAPDRGGNRLGVKAVEWKQTMGYSFAYPIPRPRARSTAWSPSPRIPRTISGACSAIRKDGRSCSSGTASGKLLLTIGDNVITHHAKAHGIAVDAQDNLWITDAAGAVAKKISPDGKVLMTIGTRGHRGDWDEAKGQRLLWEPMMVGFQCQGRHLYRPGPWP